MTNCPVTRIPSFGFKAQVRSQSSLNSKFTLESLPCCPCPMGEPRLSYYTNFMMRHVARQSVSYRNGYKIQALIEQVETW